MSESDPHYTLLLRDHQTRARLKIEYSICLLPGAQLSRPGQ